MKRGLKDTLVIVGCILGITGFIFGGMWVKEQFFTVQGLQEDTAQAILEYTMSYLSVGVALSALIYIIGSIWDYFFSVTRTVEGEIQEKKIEKGTSQLLNAGNNVLVPTRTSDTYYFVVDDIEIEVDRREYRQFKEGDYVEITYTDGVVSRYAESIEYSEKRSS